MAKRAENDSVPELTTILDFVRHAATRFGEAQLVFAHGTNDAVDDATLLISETLHLPPDRFEELRQARLTAAERRKILDLVDLRIRTRKPVAYLVQRVYMRGLAFYVDERAIVPRSHLGEIVDGALFAGDTSALVDDPSAVARVLDLCTGSGCLAILACRQFPNATVDAVDLSADALAVAERNVGDYGLQDRINLLQGDLFAPVGNARYDLIVTNPPYVDADGMEHLVPECRHEPRLAFEGGGDGLAIVGRILAEAGRHLTPEGGLLCEVGRGRSALERRFPEKNFLWVDTETSDGEVFWLDAAALR